MSELKLGKKAFVPDAKDAKFSIFFKKEQLPTIPDKVGYLNLVTVPLGMLGNDVRGNCGVAGLMHAIMVYCAMAGRPIPRFTEQNAIDFYDKYTGGEDVGVVLRDLLKYVSKHGIPDADGVLHGIGMAYVRMDHPDNLEHLSAGIHLFGLCYGGIQFPDYAMEQFKTGKPWDLQDHGTMDGGHCIDIATYDSKAPIPLGALSWGKDQPTTDRFWEVLSDEAWFIVDPEMMKDDGCDILGYDLPALKNYLQSVK